MDSVFDVIIVGGGGSGLAAAVSAAEQGVRVLVLERQNRWGGTSRMAVGSISAAGTSWQRRAGLEDDWPSFVEDMAQFTGDLLSEDNADLRAWLARHAAPTLEWLARWGVVFAGPFPEPPHRVCRMHNAVPGAAAITSRLLRACRRLGVQMACSAQVLELLGNASDRVRGVRCRLNGQTLDLTARLGVILASGDFSGNAQMRQAHLSPAAARALPINPHNEGQMFELAQSVGARYTHMSHVFGPQMRFPSGPKPGLAEKMPDWPWLCHLSKWFFQYAPQSLKKLLIKPLLMSHMSPSEQLFKEGAKLIDRQGRLLDHSQPAASIAMTPERQAFIVMPSHVAQRFNGQPHAISTAPGIAYAHLDDYRKGRPDLVHEAPSLQDLWRCLGMSGDAPDGAIQALASSGPWIAMGPVQAMLTTTEGALATAIGGQVLQDDGQGIAGLYAVGCAGQGGLLLRGHGLHLAWAYTSGRMTGLEVAQLKEGVSHENWQ
ncbi:MAG: hypothetical protein RIT26_1989 [Pseudomonadota bacterium]|jgi:fumarate reductase flavoprotein subunit